MRKLFWALLILAAGTANGAQAAECGLGQKLSGRILIQTQANGEAWYVSPRDLTRVYLGRPDDAFVLMREQALGISEKDFAVWQKALPDRYRGYILLRAEAEGQAYYANPLTEELCYLGRPDDAFALMRQAGLGITDKDLDNIRIAPVLSLSADLQKSQEASVAARPVRLIAAKEPLQSVPQAVEKSPDQSRPAPSFRPAGPASLSEAEMEQKVWAAINEYRQRQGLVGLDWNEGLAAISRQHSADMAAGRAPFSHNGFDGRMAAAAKLIPLAGMAENVAYNIGMSDPVSGVVQGWLDSPGHYRNIVGNYKISGVGVVKGPDNAYYFTQLFVLAR
jgi:uncharacterized protein YkwD